MIYILMGVSGCGKTTIGEKLALMLSLPFYDADNYHPQNNIDKMRSGNPLTDADRLPWLEELAGHVQSWDAEGGAVLACSALKESYRNILQQGAQVTWIYLHGSREMILERLQSRTQHYMSPALLDSQLEILEEPSYGLHIDISPEPDLIIEEILIQLNQILPPSEFGLIGLGVMGKSLALNLAGKGISTAVYNRHVPGKEEEIAGKFIAGNPVYLNRLKGFERLREFVQCLQKPRKVLLMIYAGALDSQIEELVPLLEPGDLIIDGGNSYYKDTARRAAWLSECGIHYLGTGISGGEEGARKGPSIMAGGSRAAYEQVGKYLEMIAARDKNGQPCATFIGPDGAGHFVKMVHNGIEYAEMQALAEVYYLLRYFLLLTPQEIAAVFSDWQAADTGSYLLEISIYILQKKEGDEFLIDKILDQAAQKGTGGLSVNAALEYAVPYGPLSEAVMARLLSSMKGQRIKAAELYAQKLPETSVNKQDFISSLQKAYKASRIVNHEIGFNLMGQASAQENWQLNLSEIARIWTNGCIIRSVLMVDLAEILKNNEGILTSPVVVPQMRDCQKDFAYVVAQGLQQGLALPALSAALNYYLGYITADSPANLIQAQRDYFGAHTYQRRDRPEGQHFHSNWKSL